LISASTSTAGFGVGLGLRVIAIYAPPLISTSI
jgi:hypothetical protein